ncbi:hypothetical protein EDB89DRAFT_1904809 [Lactarius sanguifluus]|nr:hypothetical protein EDB89DRAFT_1904809 [Lactarius sanguifluus]
MPLPHHHCASIAVAMVVVAMSLRRRRRHGDVASPSSPSWRCRFAIVAVVQCRLVVVAVVVHSCVVIVMCTWAPWQVVAGTCTQQASVVVGLACRDMAALARCDEVGVRVDLRAARGGGDGHRLRAEAAKETYLDTLAEAQLVPMAWQWLAWYTGLSIATQPPPWHYALRQWRPAAGLRPHHPSPTTNDRTDATTDIHHPTWTPNYAPTTTTTEPRVPIKMTMQPWDVRDNAAAGRAQQQVRNSRRDCATTCHDDHKDDDHNDHVNGCSNGLGCGDINDDDDDDGAAADGIGSRDRGGDRDGDGDGSRDSERSDGDTGGGDADGDNGDAGGDGGSVGGGDASMGADGGDMEGHHFATCTYFI